MSDDNPLSKYPRSVAIVTIIIVEVFFWLITVGLITFGLGVLTGQLLFLPAIISSTILFLFNFVRYDFWEYYKKQLSKSK
jgi:uncharacterized membrane protein YphA (DoxX/SURF4 family)